MKDLEWLKEEVREQKQVALSVYLDEENGEKANYYIGAMDASDNVMEFIDQVEQPNQSNSMGLELPVIPEFVADYIEECKSKKTPLFTAMEQSYIENDKVARYLFDVTGEVKVNRQSLFAGAWLDGYTVGEKKYLVKLPMLKGGGDCAYVDVLGQIWVDSYPNNRYHLTESEINNIDPRYMAFAVPVDEVHE